MRPLIAFRSLPLSVDALDRQRNLLNMDPVYQRQGDVWPRRKQRLFIDSLLNGFITPSLYWHSLNSAEAESGARYAVVDGKQRLQAIYGFLDGEFGLDEEFELLTGESDSAGGKSVAQLKEDLPWLHARLLRAELDVVVIDTDEVDLIEELFFRLNEGVPLSAAEKRNRGKILAPKVRHLADTHVFFQEKLPFGNQRFRHLDLIAKFLQIEDRGLADYRVPNLRKGDLDKLFDRFLNGADGVDGVGAEVLEAEASQLIGQVEHRLDDMEATFKQEDRLLASVGMVTLYYAGWKALEMLGGVAPTRDELAGLEEERSELRNVDNDELTERQKLLDEFGTYSQGPTSGSYLTRRLEILLELLRGIDLQKLREEHG